MIPINITVYGKRHSVGRAAKTNKPYDLTILHFGGQDMRVEGQAVMTAVLDSTMMAYDSIVVGQRYTMEFDPKGRVVYFAPEQKSAAANR